MGDSHKRKDSPEALHERFATIAQTFSLSEIARRTETPLTNVHRYAGGSRIPAEFCSALVTRMGVNPAWLLAGEGMPWTSDITAGTTAMASDLLELVEAMNAVTQMRLGALTGKHHLGVLRQLNDALVRFEDLRKRMNQHAEPVFRKLLDDLEKALSRMDVDRAEEVARATEQVARLCQEPELARRHTRLKAHQAYLSGEHNTALGHQQEVFRTSISGGVLAEQDCEEAVRLVMLLTASGRGGEGLRLAEATLLLAGEEGRGWSVYPHLAVVTGNLLVYAGRLYEGLALIKRWFAQVQGEGRIRAAQDSLRTALLCAGLMTPDEAFDFGGHNEFKAITQVLLGIYKEDAGYLERTFDYLEGGRVPRVKAYATMHYILDHGRAVLGALQGGKKFQAPTGGAELEARIFETQLYRLTGKKAQARKALAQSDAMITDGRELEVMPFVRALHYRNLLELAPKDSEEHERAEEFFNQQLEAGYEVFRK